MGRSTLPGLHGLPGCCISRPGGAAAADLAGAPHDGVRLPVVSGRRRRYQAAALHLRLPPVHDSVNRSSQLLALLFLPRYGNPEHDGDYKHWNHEASWGAEEQRARRMPEPALPAPACRRSARRTDPRIGSQQCLPATSAQVLPHWQEHVSRQYPQVGRRFQPPGELHSPFYPLRGPYSSADQQLLVEQFQEMKAAGESWWTGLARAWGMLQGSLEMASCSAARAVPDCHIWRFQTALCGLPSRLPSCNAVYSNLAPASNSLHIRSAGFEPNG